MTTTVLIIVNVFAALAIIVLALMQQSKGDMGSAFGGGGSQSMFGSRGSANFLSRLTAIMCAVFFISSLSLAYVYAQRAESNSVVGEKSVIESSEIPSIEGEMPTDGSDVPTLENDVNEVIGSDGNEVPSIDSEVPIIQGGSAATEASDAINDAAGEAVDTAIDAVEAASDEVPTIQEQ